MKSDLAARFIDEDEKCVVALKRSRFLNFLIEGRFENSYIAATDKRMYMKCRAKHTMVANTRSSIFETNYNLSQVRSFTLEYPPRKVPPIKTLLIAIGILALLTLVLGRFIAPVCVIGWIVAIFFTAHKLVQFAMQKAWLHIEAIGASSGSYFVNAFGYSKENIDQLRRIIAKAREY